MPSVRTLFGQSALFLATIIHATTAQVTCNPKYFNQPQWTCDVCGNWEFGGAPYGCQPYNATFDDLAVEYLGGQSYQGVGWDGFAVVPGSSGRALRPASLPNYAYLSAYQRGFLNLTDSALGVGGNLHSLHYGCTAAGDPTTPTACKVAFEGVCISTSNGTIVATSTVLEYTPHGPENGSLAFAQEIGPQGGFWCYNSNVIPMEAEYPVAVDLYIDEVLHGDWVITDA